MPDTTDRKENTMHPLYHDTTDRDALADLMEDVEYENRYSIAKQLIANRAAVLRALGATERKAQELDYSDPHQPKLRFVREFTVVIPEEDVTDDE